jgi:NodT family efflux transporter outer membrane factor (OMF) lipoprotein
MRSTVIVAFCAFSGCRAVGPDFQSPEEHSAPSQYAIVDDAPSHPTQRALQEFWWLSFADPELSLLVDRFASQNLDLKTAAERVDQARAQRWIVASQGLPRINATAGAMRKRVSPNGPISLSEPSPDAPLEYNEFNAMVLFSWELDLFGRVRRATESANAELDAVIEARHAIALTGIADLAKDYLQFRGLQEREEVRIRAIDNAKSRVKLVEDRMRNGVASKADTAGASAQVSTSSEDLPTFISSEAGLRNALGLLLGQSPHTLDGELRTPPVRVQTPDTVPIGLPGTLLRRRPDVREAEARLHAATAQTGVAVADFLPDISLTGNFGVDSLRTSTVFNWSSRVFSIGPSIDVPIFEGGRLRGMLHLRESAQREAAISYHKTVLQAWQEVDDALTAYREVQHRKQEIATTKTHDEEILHVAEERRMQGVASAIDVIDAKSVVLQAEELLVQAQTDINTNLVTLYEAVGGGWAVVDSGSKRPPAQAQNVRP